MCWPSTSGQKAPGVGFYLNFQRPLNLLCLLGNHTWAKVKFMEFYQYIKFPGKLDNK